MRQRLHHRPGEGDGILIVVQGTNGSRGQGPAIHDAGVEFNFAQEVWQATVADRMVLGISLDKLNPGHQRVDGAAASAKDFEIGRAHV